MCFSHQARIETSLSMNASQIEWKQTLGRELCSEVIYPQRVKKFYLLLCSMYFIWHCSDWNQTFHWQRTSYNFPFKLYVVLCGYQWSSFKRDNKDNHMKNKLLYVMLGIFFCCFLFGSKCPVHLYKLQLMKAYEMVLIII